MQHNCVYMHNFILIFDQIDFMIYKTYPTFRAQTPFGEGALPLTSPALDPAERLTSPILLTTSPPNFFEG